jgi:hypothetical protein
MAALPTIGGNHGNFSAGPTADQRQRYALRQCFLLAIREARREQKADDRRSSRWNHIIRFCRDADQDGSICGGGSVLRQSRALAGEQCATAEDALIVAVRALDPAAADDEPYHRWDEAKWAVFNAAVRFVKGLA